MITAIIVLSLLTIKDDILDIIDLFATLQGKVLIVAIVAFIATFTGLLEIRYISVYEGTWVQYSIIAVIVGIVDAIATGLLVHYKKHIKGYLKKKKRQKIMAHAREYRWIEQDIKQEIKKEENDGQKPNDKV